MYSEKEITRLSKFLSLILRHRPQTIGLQLDAQGWASVDELLQKLRNSQNPLDRKTLEYIVATNNKKRFAFNEDGTKIRASQGHSLAIDLGYTPVPPPKVLYHGTAIINTEAIQREGLKKRSRQHVHLSADKETARTVGQRHGKPIVLEVDAAAMHADGYTFFLSANGVWLTDHVPPQYLHSPAE
ncbi:MAG TPA: RNA 2'-phosphotransferase [Flavisolibacter sp.]|jgi:putative RNA 2'-phosphotransferase|nr:RNA 2'-phosphotransferase [Flavisolibacter sp.]